MSRKLLLIVCVLNIIYHSGNAQMTNPDVQDLIGQEGRAITTAVPFLTIAPDARAAALGDAGAATSPDANSIFWNPAKLAFIENDMGASISYTPWLRKLVNDMSLSYLTAYKKITREQAIGFQLKYFNMGNIQFTDQAGQPLNEFRPREFSTGLTYSRKLSDNMGVAIGMKYIHSNLAGNFTLASTGEPARPGNTAAGDIGWYYNRDLQLGGTPANLALGAAITNIGAKISYSGNDDRDFIPTNLRVGAAFTTELDPYNKITFIADVNKLMVPTPPVYKRDEDGRILTYPDGSNRTLAGRPVEDRSLINGMITSFYDAPGGFQEELRELYYSFGIEYWYNDLFAVRGGYFHEHRYKGNRQYFTMGFGVRYQVFGLDFAYMVPLQQNHPLAETLRFTLLFDLESTGQEESITD
ncbi:type IX secretion system outer membrane channel protein PorV [Cytophagaceae bacterium ABcell3]|nr:type IX secretion system outer membrane channel protein PorV [Cytophagaceae bacterium ABcell3]